MSARAHACPYIATSIASKRRNLMLAVKPNRSTATLVLACSLIGCANLPPGSTRDPRDHIERFNRSTFRFNTALDHAVLRPVARGYVKVTPRPVRTGVTNFFSNLGYTKTIGNHNCQGHPLDFGSDVARLVVNTSVGIGGVFDPATRFGLEKRDRDFGQTLGKWGVRTGAYLMLPLLGPSDVRDAFGLVPDRFMSVEGQINDPVVQAGVRVAGQINPRENKLPFDKAIDTPHDPYTLIRDTVCSGRAHTMHSGA